MLDKELEALEQQHKMMPSIVDDIWSCIWIIESAHEDGEHLTFKIYQFPFIMYLIGAIHYNPYENQRNRELFSPLIPFTKPAIDVDTKQSDFVEENASSFVKWEDFVESKVLYPELEELFKYFKPKSEDTMIDLISYFFTSYQDSIGFREEEVYSPLYSREEIYHYLETKGMSGELLADTITLIRKGRYEVKDEDEERLTSFHKLSPEDKELFENIKYSPSWWNVLSYYYSCKSKVLLK